MDILSLDLYCKKYYTKYITNNRNIQQVVKVGGIFMAIVKSKYDSYGQISQKQVMILILLQQSQITQIRH